MAKPHRWSQQQLEILLITSRRRGRWIIPKGKVDARLGFARSARQEAYEEAGISGSLCATELGWYRYQKRSMCWTVTVFALSVEVVLDAWPEMHVRQRCWFAVHDAAWLVNEPDLSLMIAALATGTTI